MTEIEGMTRKEIEDYLKKPKETFKVGSVVLIKDSAYGFKGKLFGVVREVNRKGCLVQSAGVDEVTDTLANFCLYFSNKDLTHLPTLTDHEHIHIEV